MCIAAVLSTQHIDNQLIIIGKGIHTHVVSLDGEGAPAIT